MFKVLTKPFLFIIVSFFSLTTTANDYIEITQVKMPAVPPVSRTAAIYFNLHNHAKSEIKLVGVSTTASSHAMIHRTQQKNDIAKMQHIDELVIAAESQFEFTVGNYHIMLMGIKPNLISKPFKVMLEFENLPAKEFIVENFTKD